MNKIKIEKHSFPFKAPFTITGHTFTASDTVRVIVEDDGFVDLDGPLFLTQNIDHGLQYGDGGVVSIPTPELWG